MKFVHSLLTAVVLNTYILTSYIFVRQTNIVMIITPLVIISIIQLFMNISYFKTFNHVKILPSIIFVTIDICALYFISALYKRNSLPFILVLSSMVATFAVVINCRRLSVLHIMMLGAVGISFGFIRILENFDVNGIYLDRNDLENYVTPTKNVNLLFAILVLCFKVFTLSRRAVGIYFESTVFTTSILRFACVAFWAVYQLDTFTTEVGNINLMGWISCISICIFMVLVTNFKRFLIWQASLYSIFLSFILHLWFVLIGYEKNRLEEELLYHYVSMIGYHFAGFIISSVHVAFFPEYVNNTRPNTVVGGETGAVNNIPENLVNNNANQENVAPSQEPTPDENHRMQGEATDLQTFEEQIVVTNIETVEKLAPEINNIQDFNDSLNLTRSRTDIIPSYGMQQDRPAEADQDNNVRINLPEQTVNRGDMQDNQTIYRSVEGRPSLFQLFRAFYRLRILFSI